jgi:sugar (pentulose or hexulose) kinase
VLLGIDVGTTFCKAVVVDAAGAVLGEGRAPTPWTAVPTGAEIDPEALVAATRRAAAAALAAAPPGRVAGIGVAGMAETGVLLDAAGRPLGPAIAWYDRRGAAEARAFAGALDGFSHHTGLAPGPLCTLAKLAGQRDTLRAAARWLGVPEWVAHRLGAAPVAELSLASRTGLLDLRAGNWWPAALAWLDAPAGLFAPPVAAGTCVGRTEEGAAIAVAGHDHVVAMAGAGALGADDVLHSAGTGEAYVRTSAPLAPERAVGAGLSAGRHVLPGRFALIGGGGLTAPLSAVARRLGTAPERVDAAADALPGAPLPRLEIDPRTGEVDVRGDGTPAQLWRAAAEAVAELGADVVARGDAVAGPHARIVAVGGGVRWRAVRSAKERRLGAVEWSPVREATARGAALIAGLAAGVFAGWDELAAVAAPACAGAA